MNIKRTQRVGRSTRFSYQNQGGTLTKRSGIITLLTDFGHVDGFVGIMKGVMLNINPHAQCIDISHDIPPQDIDEAAFVLYTAFRYFAAGTVHVAVVDPGVGSERQVIAAEAAGQLFVAPDNGILKYIFAEEKNCSVILVNNSRFYLPNISNTFHARDIFAPVAAHLSKGLPLSQVGKKYSSYLKGEIQYPFIEENKISGIILHIDRFGNAISNIKHEVFQQTFPDARINIVVGNYTIHTISSSYKNSVPGSPLAIWGSSGFLEIAIKNESAANKMGLKRYQNIYIT